MLNQIVRQIAFTGFLLILTYVLESCASLQAETTKINGASLVAPPSKFSVEELNPLSNIACNWVSIMPYAYVDETSGELQYNMIGRQWWGETKTGVSESIDMAHANGFSVMLKPHVWIGWGTFTGTFKPNDGYDLLKQGFKKYILDFARLAETKQVACFCFGTEWKQFITEEPAFFESLISSIKLVYSGKITYAANWDNGFNIPFWDQVDYLGFDAYFPLDSQATPSVNDLNMAWNPWKNKLNKLSQQYQKPVLFTEYGYRNIDYCTKTPWDSEHADSDNEKCQCNAYTSLFQTFYNEPWFAGGFFWKFHTQKRRLGNQFTPQNKAAWDIIKSQFLLNSKK